MTKLFAVNNLLLITESNHFNQIDRKYYLMNGEYGVNEKLDFIDFIPIKRDETLIYKINISYLLTNVYYNTTLFYYF